MWASKPLAHYRHMCRILIFFAYKNRMWASKPLTHYRHMCRILNLVRALGVPYFQIKYANGGNTLELKDFLLVFQLAWRSVKFSFWWYSVDYNLIFVDSAYCLNCSEIWDMLDLAYLFSLHINVFCLSARQIFHSEAPQGQLFKK